MSLVFWSAPFVNLKEVPTILCQSIYLAARLASGIRNLDEGQFTHESIIMLPPLSRSAGLSAVLARVGWPPDVLLPLGSKRGSERERTHDFWRYDKINEHIHPS